MITRCPTSRSNGPGLAVLAYYVDRILRGAKPADLPVEQSTTFHLSIHLGTAVRLGVTVPPSFLLRADQIVQ